jgi:hypothetical protein
MFIDPYRFQRDQLLTLPGVSPADRARFDLSGQRYTEQQPRLSLMLQSAFAGGGDITGQAEAARAAEIAALPFIERKAAELEIANRKAAHQVFNLF